MISLLQRIQPRVEASGQDGDTRVPVLISVSASSAVFLIRFPERRLTVRPSLVSPPASTLSRSASHAPTNQCRSRNKQSLGGEPFTPPAAYAAIGNPLAANFSPRRKTAQAIRASLLAKATTPTFL